LLRERVASFQQTVDEIAICVEESEKELLQLRERLTGGKVMGNA
jgi:hypothetical protein